MHVVIFPMPCSLFTLPLPFRSLLFSPEPFSCSLRHSVRTAHWCHQHRGSHRRWCGPYFPAARRQTDLGDQASSAGGRVEAAYDYDQGRHVHGHVGRCALWRVRALLRTIECKLVALVYSAARSFLSVLVERHFFLSFSLPSRCLRALRPHPRVLTCVHAFTPPRCGRRTRHRCASPPTK